MATYFTRAPQQPFCPTTGVDHRTVATYRCAGCNLRNPNYRARSPIPPDAEVIAIGDDSPNLPTKAPPRPSRSVTHLAKVPGLVLGHADLDRQHAIQREADRKPKTGIQAPTAHTIHLSVGVAHWNWEEYSSGDGNWSTCQNDKEWSIDLPNRESSSAGFLSDVQATLERLSRRSDVKEWILPKGEGEWILSHANPRKGAPQEIADWQDDRLLSEMIDQGAYNIKPRGNKKVVTLWLCWTPERPEQHSPTPSPIKNTPAKRGRKVKKEVKKEVKQEIKPEPPCTPTPASKRARAISAELSIRKRPNTTTRNQKKALEAEGPLEDEAELESLEQMLEAAAGKGDAGESGVEGE